MMNVAIDDGIKASLATLQLVKYTSGNGDGSLSHDEVETAHLSLDQVIQIAESIKERLQSRNTDEIDSIAKKSRNARSSLKSSSVESSLPSPIIRMPKSEKGVDGGSTKKSPESAESANEPSNTNGKDELPQRRLSTPCLIPMNTAAVGVSFD